MLNKILLSEKLVNASILLMGLSLLIFILYQFQDFLRPFVIAIVLSFLFVPLTRFKGMKRALVWVITILVILCLFLFGALFINAMIDEGASASLNSGSFSGENSSLYKSLDGKSVNLGFQTYKLSDLIQDEKITGFVYSFIRGIFDSIGNFFSQLVIVLMFLLFILPSYDLLLNRYSKNLKTVTQRNNFKKMVMDIEKSVREYLSIKSIVSLVTAVFSGVAMFLFGVKFVFLFMFLTFVLNFIPSFGSIFAVVIVVVSHLLLAGFSMNLIYLGVLLVVVQFVIGNIIEPKVAGKKMNLSPIVILLSLFFWGSIWGITGMFFAVPLSVIIKIVFESFFSYHK